jgi:WD40 repeat protein
MTMPRSILLAVVLAIPCRSLGDEPLPAGAKLRLGSAQLRHGGMILAVDVSPDGKVIASIGLDRVLRLWDTRTQSALATGEPSQSHASRVRFSPDGKLLAVVHPYGGFQIVDAATGKAHFTSLDRPGGTLCAAWSADGKTFASGAQDGAIHLLETAKWTELRTLIGHQGALHALGFSADGKQVLSFGADGILRRWETTTGKALGQVAVAQDRFVRFRTPDSFAFAPDGKTLAAGRTDGGIELVPVAGGEPRSLKSSLPVHVMSLSFSRDSRFVAATNAHGMAFVWGINSGKELAAIKHTLRHALGVAICPDGETLVLGRDSAIELWKLDEAKPLHRTDTPTGAVRSLAFLNGGRTLVGMCDSESLHAWDATTGKVVETSTDRCDPETGLGVIASGKGVRTYCYGPEPGWLDWEPGGRRHVSLVRASRRMHYPISPTGDTVMRWEPDRGAWLWDGVGSKPIRAVVEGPTRQEYAYYSADGKRFAASGDDGFLRVWEVETGRPFPRLGRPPAGPLQVAVTVLSDQGRALAQVTNAVRVWEVASGKERARFPFPVRQVVTGVFTPDGRGLVLGMFSGELIGIDLATGKEFVTRPGHKGPVRCLCFSKDGSVLASGGSDTTTLLWDSAVFRPRVVPGKPSRDDLAHWWDDLAGEDTARAYAAIRGLSDSPAEAVPFLRDKLQPHREPLPRRLERLIAALDDNKFAVRERATRELAEIGTEAEKALEAALGKSPTPEAKRRLEELLGRLRNNSGPGPLRPARVRELLDRLTSRDRAALEQGQ